MYLGITIEGIEDIAAEEVKGRVIGKKRVVFAKEKKEYVTMNTVLKIIKQERIKTFNEVIECCKNIKYTIDESFVIDCTREGDHAFRSVDVEKEISAVLIQQGQKRDYKHAKTKIRIDICDDLCTVGYCVADRLCRREYRVKINNQSVTGCLAAACVKAARVKKQDVVVDPFCKDGVIAIEAARLGIKKVYAFDAEKNNVRYAKANIHMARVKIDLQNKDITWLETNFKEKEINKIITNAFIGHYEETKCKEVQEMFRQAEGLVKESIIVLTNKPERIKKMSKTFVLKEERQLKSGEMKYALLTYAR